MEGSSCPSQVDIKHHDFSIINDLQKLQLEVKRLREENELIQSEKIELELFKQEIETIEPTTLLIEAFKHFNHLLISKKMFEDTSIIYDEPETHPLYIDLVVENLVKFMDYKTLKNARLVCTKWISHVKPEFKKRTKMFAKLDILDRPLREFENIFSPDIPNEDRYTALELEMPDYLRYFVARDWMVEYGKHLTHLKIGYTWNDPDDQNHDLFYPRSTDIRKLLLAHCPNLKEFIIPVPFIELDADSSTIPLENRKVHLDLLEIGMSHDFDLIDPEFGELLEEIISSIAGLKTLKLISVHRCKGLEMLINHIRTKPDLTVIENITNLDLLAYRMDHSVLNELCNVKFRHLKKLSLGRLNGLRRGDMITVCKFLKHLKSSLEELNLGHRSESEKTEKYLLIDDYCVLTLPKLPNLKIFRNYSMSEWIIKTLDFVLLLPKLEILHLDDTSYFNNLSLAQTEMLNNLLIEDVFSPKSLPQRPHTNLKELCIMHSSLSSRAVNVLVHCFPNLQKLSFSSKESLVTNINSSIEELVYLKKLEDINIALFNCRETTLEDVFSDMLTKLEHFTALEKMEFVHHKHYIRLVGDINALILKTYTKSRSVLNPFVMDEREEIIPEKKNPRARLRSEGSSQSQSSDYWD